MNRTSDNTGREKAEKPSALTDVLDFLLPYARFRWLGILQLLVICAGVIYFILPSRPRGIPRNGYQLFDPLHLTDTQKTIFFLVWLVASVSYLFSPRQR